MRYGRDLQDPCLLKGDQQAGQGGTTNNGISGWGEPWSHASARDLPFNSACTWEPGKAWLSLRGPGRSCGPCFEASGVSTQAGHCS